MIVGITMQPNPGMAVPPHIQDEQGHPEDPQKGVAVAVEGSSQAPPEGGGGYAPTQQQPPQQIAAMNGGNLPPQQVYVSGGPPEMGHHQNRMAALETQFQQSLGISAGADADEGIASTEPNSSTENTQGEDNEGEDNDDEPVKLFVGQVPKNMGEEDIFSTFDQYGPLKDVSIIRDKHTGLHRGCAFVTYWSAGDADNAREALHDKYTFPGARRPAQVKPAEPSGNLPENKLFIGMLSREAGEDEVRELFTPFGEIREIYMIRNADGSSKCAAFLRFIKRESAVEAIEKLNNSVVMEGAARPLIVKFADNKHQRQMRQVRNMRRHDMMAAMNPGGYPPYHHSMPHQMGMPGHHHPGAGPQYNMHPSQYHGGGAYGPAGGQPHHPHHPYMYAPQQYGAPPYGYQQPNRQDMRPPNPRPPEGPAGANLFVYHLPHDLTDADLATAFNPFGNVISAKVYVDKYTGESKGFGFVSYDSVVASEAAIEQMNGFQIGNKRLKVQHKRVHGSSNPTPIMQQQSQQQQQQQQHPGPHHPMHSQPPSGGTNGASSNLPVNPT